MHNGHRFVKNRLVLVLLLVCFFSLYSQTSPTSQTAASAAFLQGTDSFRAGEWMSAVFTLRKAMTYPENYNAETLYMLIAAEMYAGEYKSAYQDCETFLQNFSDSPYISYVMYHKGRALFCLGEYESAVLQLSDFCHYYPDHEMYASALFWVAEAFFVGYNYEDAEILYSRVVQEFPNDAKAPIAQYRLETIAQRGREEKLLYLLKETGEEYLASKEEYERQLKMTGSEGAVDARRRIMEAQHKISELQKQVEELQAEKNKLSSTIDTYNESLKSENADMIRELKQKSLFMQEMLKSKT